MAAIDEPLRGRISFDGTRTPTKTALFLVVCLAWLLPGLVGHDPWKYDEAIVFGIVADMLKSGDWIAFHLAGEPYLDKPRGSRRVPSWRRRSRSSPRPAWSFGGA